VKSLEISPGETSPHIHFQSESGQLLIEGRSLMDDAASFYQPVKDWMMEYAKAPQQQTVLSIRLEYVNTATSRQFLDLYKILEKIPGARVVWYFRDEDEDMEEIGQELAELTDLKIEFANY
jgi:hypothetical protein